MPRLANHSIYEIVSIIFLYTQTDIFFVIFKGKHFVLSMQRSMGSRLILSNIAVVFHHRAGRGYVK